MPLTNRFLRFDDKGADVQALQHALQLAGHQIDPTEYQAGHFGNTTAAAVIKFQQDQGITATMPGEVDRITSDKIDELLRGRMAQPWPDTNSGDWATFFAQTNKLGDIDAGIAQQRATLTSIDGRIAEQLGKLDQQFTTLNKIDGSLGQQTSTLTGIDNKIGEQLGKLDQQFTTLNQMGGRLGEQTTALTGIDSKIGEQLGKLDTQTAMLTGINDRFTEQMTKIGEQTAALTQLDTTLGGQTTKLGSIEANFSTQLEKIDQQTTLLGAIKDGIGQTPAAPLTFNLRDPRVKELHEQLATIGLAVPDHKKSDELFDLQTRDLLLQLQSRHGLARTGRLDEGTRNALATDLANVQFPNRLEGRVQLANGLPAAGMKVRLYQKRAFGDKAIDPATNAEWFIEAAVDERGFYTLPYNVDQIPGADKNPNLEIRTVDATNTPVAFSQPIVNPGRSAVVNLVAPAQAAADVSEMKLLAASLASTAGVDLARLAATEENGERQDLSFLTQVTKQDARLIATAALAGKAAQLTAIDQEPLYGAFRAGLPANPDALALVSPAAFAAALTRARDAKVINLNEQQLDKAKADFEKFALTKRRALPIPGAVSTLGQMLQHAPIADGQRASFEKLVLSHEGDAAGLWDEARKLGVPAAAIDALQLQGKLAYLTMNNAPLTTALQGEIGTQANLAQLVELDLYQKEGWVTRLKQAAGGDSATQAAELIKLIPAGYRQQNIDERLDAYATDLAQKVRESFPTQVVSRRLAKDELMLGLEGAALKRPVLNFLQQAVDHGFQLGRAPVDQFLQHHATTLFNGWNDEEKARATEGVKLLTRAYQLTPNDEAMDTLLALNFTSARQVAMLPREVFVERYWQRFGSRRITESVWDKSIQITAVTHNIYTLGKTIDSTPPLLAISGTPAKQTAAKDRIKTLLKAYPTMESLFGSLDFCECEHCRSVLSPAAYLVDLLRFIDPVPGDWAHTLQDWQEKHNQQAYDGPTYNYRKPYDALLARRPDIPHLPLTCENTHTALPYIDLVNEILEYYVVHNQRLDENAAYDTGDATSAELIAEPQHLLPDAYNILREAHYPLTLPFDLWLETTRRFCAYFETPLWQLLETFRPVDDLFAPPAGGATYDRSRIFAEYLGLSSVEYQRYTAPDVANWFLLYGYADGATALSALKSAKTLAQRLGVSYKELTALVQTAFVNPKLSALVTLQRLGVTVSDLYRYKKHAGHPPLPPEEVVELEARLAQLTAQLGVDLQVWLADPATTQGLDQTLLLHDPEGGSSFDATTLGYANDPAALVAPLDLLKLNLFVRLWKRLGWTMAELDSALHAFLPDGSAANSATLGTGLKTALVYCAHLQKLTELLNVGKNGRMKVLAFWGDLPTWGNASLYAQLFLPRAILRDDPVFDHPLGHYLQQPDLLLNDHLPALQAALTLTAEEIAQILQDGQQGNERELTKAKLSLANVSLLYRYGLLAKSLRISIRELITFKTLSGLNPFQRLTQQPLTTLAEDHPFTQTLAFVCQVQSAKAGAFTADDLDYLLRHHTPSLADEQALQPTDRRWISPLASALHTIAQSFAPPANDESITDDALRQKLALLFAPDVVESFMGFWLNQVTYSATTTTPPIRRLDPTVYGIDRVRVAYDELLQRQQVSHIGVLTDEARQTLLGKIPPPPAANADAVAAHQSFEDLLTEIAEKSKTQFQQFFVTHFDGLLSFADLTSGDGAFAVNARATLLQKLLPFLQTKLTHQTILQSMTAQTGGDPRLLAILLTASAPDTAAGDNAPWLMTQLAALAQRGLSVATSPNADLTALVEGPPMPAVQLKAETNVESARWQGFIEVPTNGVYRFYAKAGKKATAVRLWLTTSATPILESAIADDNGEVSDAIALQAGLLYGLTLEVSKLQNGAFELLIKGETTAKGPFSQIITLPQAAVDGAEQAYTRLTKMLQLSQGLGLSERDLRHLSAHPADLGGLDWRRLPTQTVAATDVTATQQTAALFAGFVQLSRYATLRRELAGDSDDLIAILARARLAPPPTVADLCGQLAGLTRRRPAVVEATATELEMTTPDAFADSARLAQLWRALQIVERFGVQVAALKKWLTPQPDAAVALAVRNTLKARYEPEQWQRIAKAIFDPLRQRQRDALVAHIMHINPALDSLEKLFEYFLLDPGMEPVVQTSRLRLAISSLQTFIQRCFLNLEPAVHPAVLNAQHWAWMKRYRVWEANRKIFLFPENWLEPEWRDDKTHLYQELESSLLQGDVTNQLAEDALYVYLKKLEQLARLEIVTMYAEEKPLGPPTLHVIGRTYAQPYQYFYRRYAHQMWSAWEPVTTEIDGNHLVAVVWRERLHLFWVTFLEKVEETGAPTTGETGELGSLPVNRLVAAAAATAKSAVQRRLALQLHWSEYFQREWTPRSSSGFGNEMALSAPFNADPVKLSVSKEADPETGSDGALLITLHGLVELVLEKLANPILSLRAAPARESELSEISETVAIMRNMPTMMYHPTRYTPYFRVISKNSRPQVEKSAYTTAPYSPYTPKASNGSQALSVTFVPQIVTTDGKREAAPPAEQTILTKANRFTLLPTNNQMRLPNAEFAPLISPFFYVDDLYTFFVEPSLTETTVDKWQGYTITHPVQKSRWEAFVEKPPELKPQFVPPTLDPWIAERLPMPAEPDPFSPVVINPQPDFYTAHDVVVQFGDTFVGAQGVLPTINAEARVITGIDGVRWGRE